MAMPDGIMTTDAFSSLALVGEGVAGEGDEQVPIGPEEPLDSFALLLLEPHSVDHLILKGTPQRRMMHTLDAEGGRWASQRVNP